MMLASKQAVLTHISHYMGLHDKVNKELPDNVKLDLTTKFLICKFVVSILKYNIMKKYFISIFVF